EELVPTLGSAPLLLLCTARETPEWPWVLGMTHLALQPLPEDASLQIVRAVGGESLPTEITEEILARAEGVPLHLEELTAAIRKRELHGRVAEAYMERFPEIAEAHPELAAQHLENADRTASAQSLWWRAAQLAHLRHALVEAIEYASKAIEASRALPASPERDW